jgi:2,3-dihydroxybiphenyl 1,2-dioxygenase
MTGALAYLGFRTASLDAWRALAGDLIGMQIVELGAAVALRMDERRQRILLLPSDAAAFAFAGFELTAAEIAALRARLGAHGIAVAPGSAEECTLRGVNELFWFADPDGNRIEIVTSVASAATPFVPGRPIGGFRAGELGLGHIALYTPRYEAMRAFYADVFGGALSDYMNAPFHAAFFHLNPRHHSIAVIGAERPGVYHVMLEYAYMDDLGRAYDIALAQPDAIGVTMGRHSNDHVLSFYVRTPDGFFIELGWAGRTVDPQTWIPEELFGPSLWGHDRLWMSDEKRAESRALMKGVADLRAPTPVADTPAFHIPPPSKH